MIFENVPKMVGMIYAVVSLLILAYLFYSGKYNKKVGFVFLILSSLMGFLIFAPMFPNQFQLLVLGDTDSLGAPIPIVLVGFSLFIILTLILGRIFCGYVCPIGAIQELLHHIPTRKFKISSRALPIIVRLMFFVAFVILGVIWTVPLLNYMGVADFFNLRVTSVYFYVFAVALVASIFIYRPGCRFVCPYGLLLSLASLRSRFKLVRNDVCIVCKKCERICPTNEAGPIDLKQECYLCNRCVEACPVDAIEFNKK